MHFMILLNFKQVNDQGDILHSEVIGVINANCKLSGMPTLQLGFNDRFYVDKNENDVELEGVSFHHCVRLAKYESDKIISFIPPDGKFELLTYRLHPKVSMSNFSIYCLLISLSFSSDQ